MSIYNSLIIVAGNKRKEPPKEDAKKDENNKRAYTESDNPLEMMKHYFNPNPQLRGVPEGALAQKVSSPPLVPLPSSPIVVHSVSPSSFLLFPLPSSIQLIYF